MPVTVSVTTAKKNGTYAQDVGSPTLSELDDLDDLDPNIDSAGLDDPVAQAGGFPKGPPRLLESLSWGWKRKRRRNEVRRREWRKWGN
jgi:hypothetical protein